ncbi:MAG: hypothetical protein HKM95_08265 [Inquilinus sp.]|nr:hypothetical protein [Inquilinus sp.]
MALTFYSLATSSKNWSGATSIGGETARSSHKRRPVFQFVDVHTRRRPVAIGVYNANAIKPDKPSAKAGQLGDAFAALHSLVAMLRPADSFYYCASRVFL